jgi:hypothetical protein
MNIEKLVVRHKRKIEVIWSPSRKIVKVNGKKVECLPSEEYAFEFYRTATSDKGGVYAEA